MSRYASTTSVPVEKSRSEIETTVRRYGADGFMSGWSDDRATIQFRCQSRVVRFVMTLPRRDDKRFTDYLRGSVPHRRSDAGAHEAWEQACRQKWRALLLLVRAKLEAVDAGIATFEESFLANVVDPRTGKTVYETIREPLQLAYDGRSDVPLLGANNVQ